MQREVYESASTESRETQRSVRGAFLYTMPMLLYCTFLQGD